MRREIIIYDTPVLKNRAEKETVSILMNSVYFYLGSAYIIKKKENAFRLVVLHNGRIMCDEMYTSARGGKVAFSRLYGDRSWIYGMKPLWTPFYDPDSEYIDEKQRVVKKFPF